MAKVKNMTTGNTMKLILAYFLPVFFSTLFQQGYSLVDSIVVGKGIGDDALASVGATAALQFFVFGFIFGLSSSIAILVSQAYGAGDYGKLRNSITMGFATCGVIALTIMAIGIIYIRPILVLLRTDESLIPDAELYIVIMLCGIPLTLLYNIGGQILSALGDSTTPFIAVVIASIINILLDVIFIVGFGMGVDGAAYATLIAQLFTAVFCFRYIRKISILKMSRQDFKFNKRLVAEVIRIGIPVAFMNSVTAIGVLVLQSFVNDLGKAYTTAYTACSRVTQFMTQPATAVGMTMSTYAGQNYGAGDFKRIRKGLGDGAKLSLVITVVGTVLLICFPRQLAGIMINDEKNISIAADFLIVNGVMLWSLCFLFLVRSTCQGMGFTFIPMLSGILELFARVVVVLVLIRYLSFIAVAVASTSAWLAALIMNGVYLAILLKRNLKNRD